MESFHTVIIGAGLAGLACAKRLANAGEPCVVIEATDRVGGRVRTDQVDGFTLDHGFQVLLTSYPACRELLDYSSLRLCPFEPGALIRQEGQFRLLSDPWRRPFNTVATASNPVGTLGDKLRIAALRRASSKGILQDVYYRPPTSTEQRLQEDGFSEKFINEFFRPFLGGVFLDETLSTSSRMLEFVFRMFAAGEIAIPADGMAAIPRQLADSLPRGTLRLQSSVESLEELPASESGHLSRHRVVISDGAIECERVVVATPSDAAARLLNRPELTTKWSGTTNLNFAANDSPDPRRLLMLRGDEDGPVQSAVVLSDISRTYAPAGKALISVSVDEASEPSNGTDDAEIEKRVRDHLEKWFGPEVRTWQLVRTYRVPYALPVLSMDNILDEERILVKHTNNSSPTSIFIAGDHCETPSIQGAMNSGLRVADRILSDLKTKTSRT
ncbi:NAD(P)/FAD-dependent oxidoreductase [Rhodopirellula sp. SWK7]|uniref:NAD(P)/FAD-dependent oxidoreductase n=1 Tax=Rhodopirellula sp. SWK7 TaxID=595460 RepID=UPI0002BDECDA|nr:NAD(P)/FAD-dependent oxidoreductase [Rhodopirellula sp. SWK7]EMI45219.1 oxidoreductase [Rhodopirellula sp. SWK7]